MFFKVLAFLLLAIFTITTAASIRSEDVEEPVNSEVLDVHEQTVSISKIHKKILKFNIVVVLVKE